MIWENVFAPPSAKSTVMDDLQRSPVQPLYYSEVPYKRRVGSRIPAFGILLPGFLATACFISSLHGGFMFDDYQAFVRNTDAQCGSAFSDLWLNDWWGTPLSSNMSHTQYRPITVLSFRLQHCLYGSEVEAYHAANILLHALCSILVVLVSEKMLNYSRPRVSLVAGILFAIHPIHSESVGGIVGRADLLCTAFAMLAFIAMPSLSIPRFRRGYPSNDRDAPTHRPAPVNSTPHKEQPPSAAAQDKTSTAAPLPAQSPGAPHAAEPASTPNRPQKDVTADERETTTTPSSGKKGKNSSKKSRSEKKRTPPPKEDKAKRARVPAGFAEFLQRRMQAAQSNEPFRLAGIGASPETFTDPEPSPTDALKRFFKGDSTEADSRALFASRGLRPEWMRHSQPSNAGHAATASDHPREPDSASSTDDPDTTVLSGLMSPAAFRRGGDADEDDDESYGVSDDGGNSDVQRAREDTRADRLPTEPPTAERRAGTLDEATNTADSPQGKEPRPHTPRSLQRRAAPTLLLDADVVKGVEETPAVVRIPAEDDPFSKPHWEDTVTTGDVFRIALAVLFGAASALCKEMGIASLGWLIVYDTINVQRYTRLTAFRPRRPTRELLIVQQYVRRASLCVATALLLLFTRRVLSYHMTLNVRFVENPFAFLPLPARYASYLYTHVLYIKLLLWPYPLSCDYGYKAIEPVQRFFDARIVLVIALYAAAALVAAALMRRFAHEIRTAPLERPRQPPRVFTFDHMGGDEEEADVGRDGAQVAPGADGNPERGADRVDRAAADTAFATPPPPGSRRSNALRHSLGDEWRRTRSNTPFTPRLRHRARHVVFRELTAEVLAHTLATRAALSSLALAAGAFLPASQLLFPVGTIVAERVLYLPSVGVLIALVLFLDDCSLRGDVASTVRLALQRSESLADAQAQRWRRRTASSGAHQRVRRRGARVKHVTSRTLALVVTIAFAVLSLRRAAVWGRPDAFELFDSAVRVFPNSAKAHFSLGTILDKRRDAKAAIREFMRAIEIYPDYADAHMMLGNMRSATGDVAGSVDAYARAFDLGENNALYNIGVVLSEHGDLEGAMRYYQRHIETGPTFPEAYNNYGLLLEDMDLPQSARLQYHRALSIRPGFGKALYNLANLEAKLGNTKDAYDWYRRALDASPENAEIYNNFGNLLRRIGQTTLARAAYETAIELRPTLAEAHNNVAALDAMDGMIDKAMERVEEALRLDPTLRIAQINLRNILEFAARDRGKRQPSSGSSDRAPPRSSRQAAPRV